MTKRKKARLTVAEGRGETHDAVVGEQEDRAERYGWTGQRSVKAEPAAVDLRCVWHTRLVIRADMTPSGTRYDVQPGEVVPVDPADREYLLWLEKKQPPGCCGGVANPPPLKYFVEV